MLLVSSEWADQIWGHKVKGQGHSALKPKIISSPYLENAWISYTMEERKDYTLYFDIMCYIVLSN